ncbi:NmrA-like domain-containing protein [Lipomyces starkeyi]|uniref:NmrA-like domain-containing protein n=1 Tax=Lipomyces starkeyi NRRL Y-11557 TaxID=675824 RepID=A0A1E3Q0G0_LIPST|nr:hypothetical protein LIPSTDRAFT_64834 [Lipomyces starkeyi NRRL Y-11557]
MPAAQTLQQKGVEVVKGDLNDEGSIKQALQSAHSAKSRDVRQGKAIADTAVAAGAQYFIYSPESHAGKISGGKYPVDVYDAKPDLEQYIRSLPIKSASHQGHSCRTLEA